MTRAFGKVAVLFGGLSAEREVSLNSGNAVLAALKRAGVDAHGIDVGRDIVTVLERGKFDRAFIALHGRMGEDGTIQAVLEMLDIPYTGSGVLGSALGMNKLACKRLWNGAGVPNADYFVLENEADLARCADALGFPVFVKPANEGSSIGIGKAHDADELRRAFEAARACDPIVFAERGIDGTELTCAILRGHALPMIRLETPRTFYDYEAKYKLDTTRYVCPCGLPRLEEEKLQALAVQAFNLVGCSGWGRVDFMLDRAGNPYVLEVNTVPGMTDHSLVPMAAKAAGLSFDDLVLEILATAEARA